MTVFAGLALPLPFAFAATHAASVSFPVVRYAVRNPMRLSALTVAAPLSAEREDDGTN